MRRLLIIAAMLTVGFSLLYPAKPALAISSGEVTVQTAPNGTVGSRVEERFESSWPWYLSRASGLIAALALIILMLSGIGQITGRTFRYLDPLTAWASHRALGITFTAAVLVHVLLLLLDEFITFNIIDILVPWVSSYKPVTLFGYELGSLYVALGVLAMYLVLAITITSLIWVEKKPHTWKWLHLLSYIAVVFVFVHALFIGTDLATGWLRWLWLGLNGAVLLAVVMRLWRAWTI
jgi:sulfoxide reductase heme-binding subunit YedZ